MSKKMTPCERLGYKVGDKFKASKSGAWFNVGEEVELGRDDGSKYPYFFNARMPKDSDGGWPRHIESIEKISNAKLKPAKQALADAIHQNGGWPKECHWMFAASNGFGSAFCWTNKPKRSGWNWLCGGKFTHCCEIGASIPNWHQTVLRREEYYQAYPKADADGWIEWSGGGCPIGKNISGDIKLACGEEFFTVDMAMWNWQMGNDCPRRIIAYRLHKPEQSKPEFCESVMRSIPEPEINSKNIDITQVDDTNVVESKPTIEQLAADYRNKLDYANRKQDEADKANMESDAALAQLEDAIAEIGFAITPLVAPEKEPELVIAVQVGDEVECVESNIKRNKYNGMVGRLHFIDESDTSTPYLVDFGGKERIWCHEVKFIRRP